MVQRNYGLKRVLQCDNCVVVLFAHTTFLQDIVKRLIGGRISHESEILTTSSVDGVKIIESRKGISIE